MPAYGQPLYTTDLAEMVAVEAVSQGDSGHWAQVSCYVITLWIYRQGYKRPCSQCYKRPCAGGARAGEHGRHHPRDHADTRPQRGDAAPGLGHAQQLDVGRVNQENM